jgi:hypothetical protein
VYLLIPTQTGEAVLDSLSGTKTPGGRTDEGLEQAAQSFTALLKCSSCLVHTSESHAVILEIRLSGSSWEN